MHSSRKLLKLVPRVAPANISPASICFRGQSTAAETKHKKDDRTKSAPDFVPNKSFVMNMFCGNAVTEQLLPYVTRLTEDQTETLQMLIDPTDKFFQECNNPARNDELESIDETTMQGLKEMGAFGMQVPAEYGGLGCNNTQYARMVEIVGSHDLGVGITLGAHQSIGFKGILILGTPEQKAKYLPKCASGEELAAFALTEPGSGSDASSIKSRAVLSEDGSHYVLNGSKIWISNGGLAEVFTVFAKTTVTNDRGETKDKVTSFIVERSFGGVTNGPPEKKMGIKCSNTTEVYFDDVKIPAENVLGGVGNGFKVAMEILNNGRFGMAAALSGTMRSSIAKAVDFAVNRTQFDAKIRTFGTIQEKLARMAMLHYVTESLAFMVSSNMDGGSTDYHLEAAISKMFASEAAWHVADEAIQIMGGMGFMKESGLERVVRDLRIFRIFEGTNDILRLFLSLTGMQYCGNHLKSNLKAIKNPFSNLGLLMDETSRRSWRALGYATSSKLKGVHPSLSSQADDVGITIAKFNGCVESLVLKHKQDIVNHQFELNRIANATMELYTSAVVLSRATKSLEEKLSSAEHEQRMARVWVNEACQRARYHIMIAESSQSQKNFADFAAISDEMCSVGGVAANRVLGF